MADRSVPAGAGQRRDAGTGPRTLGSSGVGALVRTRRDDRLSPEDITDLLRERLGDHVLDTVVEYDTYTVVLDPEGYVEAARICRDDRQLAFDLFDCLFGVDAREEGFDVVTVLYSTQLGARILLRTRCPGGREAPTCPTLTHLYRGAVWMERETWDMFGIDFEGHPGLAPRILTTESFEGWPLRKDFYLASREAKPWPGVKEPAELDEEGNVIERVPGPGDAPGPTELDKAMAEQAKRANPAPELEQTAEADAADEPETGEGAQVADAAAVADTAEDSAQVVAGEQEQLAEETEEADVSEAKADEGEASRADEGSSAGERAGEDERVADEADAATVARERADAQRRAAAEARARKAAERAEQAREPDTDEPGEDPDGDPGGEP